MTRDKTRNDFYQYLTEDCGYFLPSGPKFQVKNFMLDVMVGRKKCIKIKDVTNIREPPNMKGLSTPELAEWLLSRGFGDYLPIKVMSKCKYANKVSAKRDWIVNLCANLDFEGYKSHVATHIKRALTNKELGIHSKQKDETFIKLEGMASGKLCPLLKKFAENECKNHKRWLTLYERFQ